MKRLFFLFLLILTACGGSPYIEYRPDRVDIPKIEWQEYEPDSLASYAESKKLVLLYLEMKNCQACQQMKETTLADPIVILKVNESYVPLISKEDDAHFDFLSNKYRVETYPAYVAIAYPDYDQGIMVAQGIVDIKTFIMFLKASKDMNALLNMQLMGTDLLKSLKVK